MIHRYGYQITLLILEPFTYIDDVNKCKCHLFLLELDRKNVDYMWHSIPGEQSTTSNAYTIFLSICLFVKYIIRQQIMLREPCYRHILVESIWKILHRNLFTLLYKNLVVTLCTQITLLLDPMSYFRCQAREKLSPIYRIC